MREPAAAGALAGWRVVTFESRRAEELARMLERHGASVSRAPALREIPIEESPAALEMLTALEEGRVDVTVLLTGVGTDALVKAVATRCPPERFAALLARTEIVARGPKPVAALRRLGLTPNVLAAEPNTWRELLAAVDATLDLRGKRVWVQEYGRENPDLLAALAARGAAVHRVPVYQWALPEDLRPLEAAIRELADGRTDLAIFTTAIQIEHVFRIAGARAAPLAEALRRTTLVAAIGPTAAAALAAHGIASDIVASPPKLGPLVAALAREAPAALSRKRVDGGSPLRTGIGA